ncbi:MAG: hypothetical protein A2Y82_00890 [Candidatus Buchananbacteria bacterium RBG_13_36_9]|uniref:Uncharacterized protein n=1 Tax=Candidatus Buchananbacteria bacterium RBG_13_36_9 TaxID=1797530 RepID=A0A1G1XMY0_9BACT|nr:MAG: hypothetical protein A2Y82_00890 [Candidatus Buchananbacteria bacterium RBG_13_36_9]
MMLVIKKIIKICLIIICLFFLTSNFCFAALKFSDWQAGLQTTASRAGVSTAPTLVDIMVPLINAALALIGIFFFLLFLYGGFQWLTAAGATDKVAKAKKLIINAVIGLAIIVAAYAITLFIGQSLEGQNPIAPPATSTPVAAP